MTLANTGRSSRRPNHAAPKTGRQRRVTESSKNVPRSSKARKPSISKASNERTIVARKTQRSSKAASKGAILILAVALIAIKAFSSLPSTTKTSADTRVSGSKSSTSTTSPASFSSSAHSSSANTPDQVVLPAVNPTTSTVVQRPATTTTASPSNSNPVTSSANSLVTVRVFNATTIAGAAAKITNRLAQVGYDVVAPTNSTVQNETHTVIYYSPGYHNQAGQVALVLGVSASNVRSFSYSAPIPSIKPSDLNIVLGTDKAN